MLRWYDVEVHVEGITAGAGNIDLHRWSMTNHGHLGVDLFKGLAHLLWRRSAAQIHTAGTPVNLGE